MLKLGQKVVIVADSLEQNLPMGEYGYIIAYDRNNDSIFDYIVRIPKVNRQFFVPGCDIETEEVLLEQEADRIEKEALIDYALATNNEGMFRRIMNGELLETQTEEKSKEVQSNADFVKQINLKAWI